ncbi:LacI family DNA-binding transcriptional regulator [Kitasatospora nipponensis]|uniref:LacI family DNA-binding transcriptional regulator n=1 Tax=Kitasatospora nipponensis TaxID=258049 RepID=A0ABP4HLB1_9ACTN
MTSPPPGGPPQRPARLTPVRRSTMKDIARQAGVSESAVSFALNGRPGVSEATRERVRRVAEELGWQASTAARSLSGEGTATVGLVLARPARALGMESFFLQLVAGIQQVLAQRQLGLLFQVVEDLPAECATYRRWWAEHRVDGVLLVDPRTEDPRLDLLDSLAMPTVVIGGRPGHQGSAPTVAHLWVDDSAAMALVVDYLYRLGHRRIAHVAGLPELAHTQRRIHSLRTEADRLGLPGAHSLTTDYSEAEGAAATRRLLDGPQPPTAIVYDSDVLAAAGAAVATERSLTVGRGLSVVAWEDSVLCRMAQPPLTALARDAVALGRTAAEQLTGLLDTGTPGLVQFEAPRLIVRESTSAAPPPGG